MRRLTLIAERNAKALKARKPVEILDLGAEGGRRRLGEGNDKFAEGGWGASGVDGYSLRC